MVKNPPVNSHSIPDSGRSQCHGAIKPVGPQLLAPHAATTEAHVPRVCAPDSRREVTAMRNPHTTRQNRLHSQKPEKVCTAKTTQCSQKKKKVLMFHYNHNFL